jgi:hypothetical protein
MRLSIGALLILLTALGCGATPSPSCSVDAECASGICMPNGRCAPQHDSGVDGGIVSEDAAVSFDDSGVDAGGRCLPNEDGVLQRNEAPFGPGLMARYRTTSDVSIDTAGSDLGGGRRRWDYEAALPGDHDFDVATEPLDGRWFADLYPGAEYVARLNDESDLLGVFRVTDTALELMGVVSPNDGTGRTELTHTPPVRVLVFPLEAGARWTSTATVTGIAQGLAARFTETYESEVDAHGEITTPYAPFDALRVRTTLTRDVAFDRTVVRQFLFVAECFGTVATIVSNEDEPEIEFDRAAEARRLGF